VRASSPSHHIAPLSAEPIDSCCLNPFSPTRAPPSLSLLFPRPTGALPPLARSSSPTPLLPPSAQQPHQAERERSRISSPLPPLLGHELCVCSVNPPSRTLPRALTAGEALRRRRLVCEGGRRCQHSSVRAQAPATAKWHRLTAPSLLAPHLTTGSAQPIGLLPRSGEHPVSRPARWGRRC
jgi:hypothetical protein